jgi:hypothetical protein
MAPAKPAKTKKAPRRRRFKVGDRVRFKVGTRRVSGVIIEDRGLLAAGPQPLYAVRTRLDEYNESIFEMPADELSAR